MRFSIRQTSDSAASASTAVAMPSIAARAGSPSPSPAGAFRQAQACSLVRPISSSAGSSCRTDDRWHGTLNSLAGTCGLA